MDNEWDAVTMFEEKVAKYTGAPYVVSVDSCTNAIFLSLKYQESKRYPVAMPISLTLPLRTYISVPQSAIHAGYRVIFKDYEWLESVGMYQLEPSPVWDGAKMFRPDMYVPGRMICLSCHSKKPIPIGKGGLILTDDKDAVDWIRKARYEGRTAGVPYKEDLDIETIGWNMYMTPDQAIRGAQLMDNIPEGGVTLDEPGGYPDLSKYQIFKHCKVIG